MPRKRLPKLDPPTKPFKVDGVPSGLAKLFDDYVQITAELEGKTNAQAFVDMFLPIVTEGFTQECVDRSLRIYNRRQEQIRKMHIEASENTPK